MNNQNYIEVKNYVKRFRNATVLDDINLSIARGEIVGFVGENGSGKTMLFRAISGLIRPSGGSVKIEGKMLGRDISFPPSMGIVLENVGLWPQFSGIENLRILSRIKKQIGDQEIKESLRRVGLPPNDKRAFAKYSLGMKRRLMVAQAIMEAPDLLILDEPTNALDENGVERIRQIILEERRRGTTVLLASHNADDISLLCDRIYRLYAGKIICEEKGKAV